MGLHLSQLSEGHTPMSTEEEDSGTIHKKTVTELVRAFRNADDGDFTFLIGAGASAPEPAEIPTADKMIQQFQKKDTR